MRPSTIKMLAAMVFGVGFFNFNNPGLGLLTAMAIMFTAAFEPNYWDYY